jgi:ABC-type proline/glycine betaine transport system permease subunit
VGQAANDLILLGAIPIIILALVVDATMRAIIKVAKPKGLAGVK